MLKRKHQNVKLIKCQTIKNSSKTQPSENISETDYSQLKSRYTQHHDLILPSIKFNCKMSLDLNGRKRSNNSQKKIDLSMRNKSLQNSNIQKQKVYNPYKKYYEDIININNNLQLQHNEKVSLMISKLLPINEFFKKITPEMINILLKIGTVKEFKQNQMVYQINKSIKYVYIIILGKVKLYNENFKIFTYCINGESLGQQTLFIGQNNSYAKKSNEISHLHRQTAVCHTDVILLKISIKKLLKLGLQLTSIDCKHHFKKLESILRMNYIKKNQKLKEKIC